ncbi:hypothetical protein P170DRAFT_438742 [Aspergillus steynii IBT 23096]|uniref:Uncharacterized protein n=1 Tax=Aspergillus steynii IBT 23096 TaxID=1392250 RepID=A0A2I2G2C2_9EURO|nr:uncharacterized protein P170DRAFT_438742 [Aspergillus steynii IBT 23096]PLB47030.1 hypothetical protein P170DRAFT_438742 [Aspergillus steynii IBT 23096]
MCLVEEFTDVYPMEDRLRRVIYHCSSSDGERTCRKTRIRNCGEVYHARHDHPTNSPETPPLRYRRSRADPQSVRRVSPVRSRPFKLRFPFLKSSPEHVRVQEIQGPRDRKATLDPSAIRDPHGDDTMRSRQRFHVSASPRLHTTSPQRTAGSGSTGREREQDNSLSREARPQQRSQARRLPRERTPVVERVPLRRKDPQAPARVVEVHNDPRASCDEEQHGRRKGDRQVRFSNTIDYEGGVSKGRQYPSTPTEPRRDYFLPGKLADRYRNVDRRASPQRVFSKERPYIETRTPRFERSRDAAPSPSASLGPNRPQPRIIQDGNRHVAEAGQRILVEARRRQTRERFTRDLRSYTAWRPWNRRSEGLHESDISERIGDDGGSRRYKGWRWR